MINFEHSTGFDLETFGDIAEYMLQPYRATTGQAGIKAVGAFYLKPDGELYPSTDKLREIISPAISNNQYIIGWNVAFDAAWLIAVGLEELVFKAKWLDAMLLWRHALVEPEGEDVPKNKRKSYSLESAMKEFYPEHANFKEFDDFEAIDEASLKLLLKRVRGDAVWPVRLAEKFWGMLTPRQRTAALIEARCIPMMAKNKVMGLYASKEGAEELEKILAKEAVDLYRQLLNEAPEVKGLNLGSPKQLQQLIYETWGMTPERFSKKTNLPSTDKFALFDLAKLDPRCALLKKIREAKNNRKKYAVGTLNSLEYNGDGYVRPQPKIFSTYTSRITYGSSDRCSRKYIKTFKKKPPEEQIKKVEVPVGIALHQWKRGKEYRKLIKPPPGYFLVEFDFAGQEYRWMAVASEDETMLSLCAPGEDPHGYMGAQIAQRDYRELMILNKAGDSEAANDRKCGKFCVAEGELVLTDRGLVPIEKVLLADRVWDGVEWVHHEGLIYQGEKEVMTYDGLTATPDHKVYLQEGGFCRLDEAAAKGSRLARTGDGGSEIQFLEDYFNKSGEIIQKAGAGRPCKVQVRSEENCTDSESKEWKIEDVQEMYISSETRENRSCSDQWCGDETCPETMQCYEATMRESKRRFLQKLRCSRGGIPVHDCSKCNIICPYESSASDIFKARHRQDRQRWSLRAWESQTGDKIYKSAEQEFDEDCRILRQAHPNGACLPCGPNFMAGCTLYRSNNAEFDFYERLNSGRDTGQVSQHAKLQTKRTYDLANAGPRHCFTVSNCLIFNCNLSYQYRVSARTATTKARVDFGLEVDETFISQTQMIYRESYIGVGGPPGRRVGGYWASQIQKCKHLGYAETFAGRRVQLKDNWAGKFKWAMESTAINYPIQGTGGDQKYLALAVARNILPKYDGYFYYELHDGLFFIFPEAKALAACDELEAALSNLPYKAAWGIDLPIQFPVDGKIGTSWGELEDLNKYRERMGG